MKRLETLRALLYRGLLIVSLVLPCAASSFKIIHKFQGPDGGAPVADLIADAAGNLYGTAETGGNAEGLPCSFNTCGLVYELTPSASGEWSEKIVYKFSGPDGYAPMAGLIFDHTGNLYGTTASGGTYGAGTVFELSPNTDGSWSETVLHSFDWEGEQDGAEPNVDLIFDNAGNLYGTTYAGGPKDYGIVFKLLPNGDGTWSEKIIHNFESLSGGANPLGGLTMDAAGNLYGTAPSGGIFHDFSGLVYKLAPDADDKYIFSVLYEFCQLPGCHDGAEPISKLTFDGSGNLFGTTLGGGRKRGVIFELTPQVDGSWSFSVFHAFAGNPAAFPQTAVTFDTSGSIYGATLNPDTGSVYRMALQADGSWQGSQLHAFGGEPAYNPTSNLLLLNGKIYGTTLLCGTSAECHGTVYEITP